MAEPATKTAPLYPRTGWGVAGSILITAVSFVLSLFLGSFVFVGLRTLFSYLGLTGMTWYSSSFEDFVYILVVEIIGISIIWCALRFKKRPFSVIGVARHPLVRDLWYALAGFAVYFVMLIVLGNIWDAFSGKEDVQDLGFEAAAGLQLLYAFVSLAIIPPIAEELLFRGFLFGGLRGKGMHLWWAAILTSLLFGLPHIFGGKEGEGLLWFVGLDTFLMSLVLCYIREKTGALWAGMGIHALKNTVAFIILFVVQ